MPDNKQNQQVRGEWSQSESNEGITRETAEWPPRSTQQPIVERIQRWSKNKWRRSLKPYTTRIGAETAGMVVLGAVLGAAWTGISYEMIAQVFAQANHPLSQPWIGLMAGITKFLGFVAIAWAGVAIVFRPVRDTRSVPQLFAQRPLRTTFYTVGLTGFSLYGVILGWILSRILMRGELLSVTWWQTAVGVSVFAVLYAAVIDGGYKSLYYSS